MTEDARFEDGAETPLALIAADAEDVPVIAALLQDAVLTAGDLRWNRKARQFSLLVNRFRWEDAQGAEARGRAFERVRSVLSFGDVRRITTQGIDPRDADVVLSVLDLAWEPGEDGTGRAVMTLAGDGAIAVEAECINLLLKDVTRPYAAPSGRMPHHPE